MFSGCKKFLASGVKDYDNEDDDVSDDNSQSLMQMNFTGRYRVFKNKVLYCPIEKTGSTTWNGIFDKMKGAAVGKVPFLT